jgi:hypothetical protein
MLSLPIKNSAGSQESYGMSCYVLRAAMAESVKAVSGVSTQRVLLLHDEPKAAGIL